MRLRTRRRSRWAGVLALLGAAALTAMAVSSGSAGAADTTATVDHFGPPFTITGTDQFGQPVSPDWAFLIFLKTPTGDIIRTYCVDIYAQAPKGEPFHQVTWAASGKPNLPQIRWALQHGYPVTTLAALTTAAGATGLTEAQAIGATQAAIWHYSNNFTLSQAPAANAAPVRAVYNYLTGAANTGSAEPVSPTLGLTVAGSPGTAGTPIGPLTVHSTGGPATLALTGAPAGTRLVDSAGQDITGPVADGGQAFVLVPAGTATGNLTVTASVGSVDLPGHVWESVNNPNDFQHMMLIDGASTTLNAAGPVTWSAQIPTTTPTTTPTTGATTTTVASTTTSAVGSTTTATVLDTSIAPVTLPPSGVLPATGSDTAPLLGAAGALFATGVALLVVRRRATS
jgi:TQXA domain-containing protein/LPXTG-motif cell wall-anchored protein